MKLLTFFFKTDVKKSRLLPLQVNEKPEERRALFKQIYSYR